MAISAIFFGGRGGGGDVFSLELGWGRCLISVLIPLVSIFWNVYR